MSEAAIMPTRIHKWSAGRRVLRDVDAEHDQGQRRAQRRQCRDPDPGARLPRELDAGQVDAEEEDEEAGAAHGGDGLERHEIGDDQCQGGADQRAFGMLATDRALQLARQLAGLGDDIGEPAGAVEGGVDRRCGGHERGDDDRDIAGRAEDLPSGRRERRVAGHRDSLQAHVAEHDGDDQPRRAG